MALGLEPRRRPAASEVKALAEQTAKATGEIGQQISGIQAATQESVHAIKEISGTIEMLSERQRDRIGLAAGLVGGKIAVRRQQ
jgi:methyl-accepting chemotaxis protein